MAPSNRQNPANRYLPIASSRSSPTASSLPEVPVSTPATLTTKVIDLGNEASKPQLDPQTRFTPRQRNVTNNSDSTVSSFQSPFKSPHDASIFVGNLPPDLSELDLIMALNFRFKRVADVQHVKIVPDPRNNSRCAFVQVNSAEDAREAITAMNGQLFHGHQLRCELARAHRSLLVSIRHPNEVKKYNKIEFVRLKRSRGDRTVHVSLGEEAKHEPDTEIGQWSRRDPLQGSGQLISLENLFGNGRVETIRKLMEAFGPIEHFGRFVSDDPATVFDPHPTPDSWRLDSTDERSSGNVHPRGPWEIKFERRNDSVSAFMALKQIPLFNVSRTHMHRPADIGFLNSGNDAAALTEALEEDKNTLFIGPLVMVDDRRQESPPTIATKSKSKPKRMRRGAVAMSDPKKEDFPPLSTPESKKDVDIVGSKPTSVWNTDRKKLPGIGEVETLANDHVLQLAPLIGPETHMADSTQSPKHKSHNSLESSIFDATDSEDGNRAHRFNALGLSVNSASHKSETPRKSKKAFTCIEISGKVKGSGHPWDLERITEVFGTHEGFVGATFKTKRKPAGSFVAHVEFNSEAEAQAACDIETERFAFAKQMRLVPARSRIDQTHPTVDLQATESIAPPVLAPSAARLDPVGSNAISMERTTSSYPGIDVGYIVDNLSPALSSTLPAESPRLVSVPGSPGPSVEQVEEIEVAAQLESATCSPSTDVSFEPQPQPPAEEESSIERIIITVSESTCDEEEKYEEDQSEGEDPQMEESPEQRDGGDVKVDAESHDDQTDIKLEESESSHDAPADSKPATQDPLPDVPKLTAAVSLIPSRSAPGVLPAGTRDSREPASARQELLLPRRRALSDSDSRRPTSGSLYTFTPLIPAQCPENASPAVPCDSLANPPQSLASEWCEAEIQASSPQLGVLPISGSSQASPMVDQVPPPVSAQRPASPIISPAVSPFGALVYIPPPFDCGSTGTTASHFNSPVPAKGFVETPHGLLPIYPREVLDRFGRPAPAYYPPQYATVPQPHWGVPPPWQPPHPGGQWLWGGYYSAPYPGPFNPGQAQPTQTRQPASAEPYVGQAGDVGLESFVRQYAQGRHNRRGSQGSNHGLSQKRPSRQPAYRGSSPGFEGSRQASISPHHSGQSFRVPPLDHSSSQAHNYTNRGQPTPPLTHHVNDTQTQPNIYQHSQYLFNQQELYMSSQSHHRQQQQQQYQPPPPPFNSAYMYQYPPSLNDQASVPSIQQPDYRSQSYSLT